MAFDPATRASVSSYIAAHLPADSWYADFFDFVPDAALAARLAEEFKSARTVYKLLRGLDATGWLLNAQIRIQVLQYASIYEAVIHHLLFDRFGDTNDVRALVEYRKLTKISIPPRSLEQLKKALEHDGKEIIPTYQGTGRVDESKVRFDDKVACAVGLDLIDADLGDDLVGIYEARNAIHIHAELRKNLKYEIELGRTAYRRMAPFREQVVEGLRKHGKLLAGGGAPVEFDPEAI
ncbi:MAG: hypothetical protein K2Y26_01690 [Gemmatimonadaceae bacterium]|nr:hypothetical protein [Gemmatimonadaceae bacterium]